MKTFVTRQSVDAAPVVDMFVSSLVHGSIAFVQTQFEGEAAEMVPVPNSILAQQAPVVGDYLVKDANGGFSFMAKDAFESTFQPA